MKKSKISSLEISALFTFLYKGFLLIGGINLLLSINSSDTILSSILSLPIGFLVLYVFLYLHKILPKYSIFGKINQMFPPDFAIFLKAMLLIPVIIFSSYALYNISSFVQAAILNNVDVLPISLLFLGTVLYLVHKGIPTLTKASLLCLFIFVVFEIITVLFSLPNIHSNKILPLLESSMSQTACSSMIYLLFSISLVFLLLMIPKNQVKDPPKFKKYMKFFYFLTSLYLIFYLIFILSIVDKKLALSLNYPSLFALSKISLLNFFDRMEDILSFKFIMDSFFMIACSLIYFQQGLKSILKKKHHQSFIFILLILLPFLLSNFINLLPFLLPSLSLFFLTNLFIAIYHKFT